ncbi:MAG: methyltransferase domain-containing protein [Candidatus Hydrogenedentes bacterium]|nr:methyltransferase domain-containing protein [Candidatus Hydrogenedentota bacterium]
MKTWNAESILELSRAFMGARLLLTGAELNVFTHLSAPKTLDEAVAAMGSQKRGTEILLDALSAMGLLEKKDGRYNCPQEIASLLSSDAPNSVRPMILHSASVWDRWSELSDVVRSGKKSGPPAGLFEDEELTAFIYAMHVVGRHLADAVAARAKAEDAKSLLDVGGATGTYAEAFARRYPGLRATVFDRPLVIKMAENRLAASEVRDRIALAAGDFYDDPLPGGHDLVFLSAIIHQNSPEQNTALYQKCFEALEPGGRILVRDHVLSPDRTQPVAGAIFAVNMLVATEGGNCYTFEDIQRTLAEAGFERIALLQEGMMMDGLVEAYKP